MGELPADVASVLARAVGAYLRATPTTELPPKLRRFQSFRPKGLTPHRAALIAALDDDGIRARVLEWLDEKPSIDRREADVLRVAAERAEGWDGELAGRTRTARKKPFRGTEDGAALDREKEKTRRAREEARRAREDAQESVRKLRAEIAALKTGRDEEKARAAKLGEELERATAATERARGELDRERRKAKTAVDKAQSAAEEAKRELKELRRELQQRTQELSRLQEKVDAAKTGRKQSRRSTAARQPRGPRKPLPVPKGRFADAPETLDAWLEAKDVHLLVDGYNASMSEAGFARLDLAAQRDRMVDGLTKLARSKQIKATVVFDGSDVASLGRKPRSPVAVHYSAPDEIADDHLIGLLETMPAHSVVVATSDRELQGRAAKLGATIATSEQLLGLLR